MPAEIRETIVTASASGAVVQLQISDAPLQDESPGIRLTLLVKVAEYRLPLLAHLQREAMKLASDALVCLLKQMAGEIREGCHPLDPPESRRS